MKKDYLFKEAKNFFSIFEAKSEILTGMKVPGSVTLIGDTSEFNKGKIIGANIDKQSVMFAQKRRDKDRFVYFYSKRYDEKIRVNLSEPQIHGENGWANFMAMALFELEGSGKRIPGMHVYIDNNIPDFFNCNNVEALQIGIVQIAEKFGDWTMTAVETAELCAQGDFKFMKKERNSVKYMPILNGQKGMLTYYDAAKKEAENIPCDINSVGLSFMVMSSGIKNKSVERRVAAINEEVKQSLATIRNSGGQVESLDQLSMEAFDEYRGKLTLSQKKRCAYFISENERSQAAAGVLKTGNILAFVDIVNESQKNIKNRLEIIDGENESLLNIINDAEGVKAARVLNMGLDGTVFVIVDNDKKQHVESKVRKAFMNITGLDLQTEHIELSNVMEEVSVNISEFGK